MKSILILFICHVALSSLVFCSKNEFTQIKSADEMLLSIVHLALEFDNGNAFVKNANDEVIKSFNGKSALDDFDDVFEHLENMSRNNKLIKIVDGDETRKMTYFLPILSREELPSLKGDWVEIFRSLSSKLTQDDASYLAEAYYNALARTIEQGEANHVLTERGKKAIQRQLQLPGGSDRFLRNKFHKWSKILSEFPSESTQIEAAIKLAKTVPEFKEAHSMDIFEALTFGLTNPEKSEFFSEDLTSEKIAKKLKDVFHSYIYKGDLKVPSIKSLEDLSSVQLNKIPVNVTPANKSLTNLSSTFRWPLAGTIIAATVGAGSLLYWIYTREEGKNSTSQIEE